MPNQVRKSSGALVWRFRKGVVEVLLVESTNSGKWVFPKGGIEPGLTARQNAVKECWEEAGVIGDLGESIAVYSYVKSEVKQVVTIFDMECVAVLEDYPEVEIRTRRWFPADEALLSLNRQLREVLLAWLKKEQKPALELESA